MSSATQPSNLQALENEAISHTAPDAPEPDVATEGSSAERVNVPPADDNNRVPTPQLSADGLIAPTVSTLVKQMQNDLNRFLQEKLASLEPTPQTKPESVRFKNC